MCLRGGQATIQKVGSILAAYDGESAAAAFFLCLSPRFHGVGCAIFSAFRRRRDVAIAADGLIPSFGFGARFPDGSVSHCFNLNGQTNPECNGVGEVLANTLPRFANLGL